MENTPNIYIVEKNAELSNILNNNFKINNYKIIKEKAALKKILTDKNSKIIFISDEFDISNVTDKGLRSEENYIVYCTSDCTYIQNSGLNFNDIILKSFPPDVLKMQLERIFYYNELINQKKRISILLALSNEQMEKSNAALLKAKLQTDQLAEKRARELIHAERMSTIGLMSAGIAHEINNPTSYILTCAEVIYDTWNNNIMAKKETLSETDLINTDKILKEQSQMITNGTKRISKIVDSLRNFVKKNDTATIKTEIDTCIEQSLILCHNRLKYNIEVEKDINKTPEITVDPQQIEQVIVNLINNAADAIGKKKNGIIGISTRYENGHVTLKIRDNGTGIPEDKIEKIFEPFYSTKTKENGTGLGLPISKGIIESFNGTITVSNTQEGGAEFLISIPVGN